MVKEEKLKHEEVIQKFLKKQRKRIKKIRTKCDKENCDKENGEKKEEKD